MGRHSTSKRPKLPPVDTDLQAKLTSFREVRHADTKNDLCYTRTVNGSILQCASRRARNNLLLLELLVQSAPWPGSSAGPANAAACGVPQVCFVLCSARDTDMPIVYASNSFLDMCGYTLQDVIGRNCRFLPFFT